MRQLRQPDLHAAGVAVTPVSLEQNVRGVVTKVTAGEADAGIVYVTDVIAAGDAADMVEIPADINVVAEYPIASVAASANQEVDAGLHRLPARPRRPGDPRRVRVRPAVTVTAPAAPVAVRTAGSAQERLPVPALVLAVIAIAFFALPFVGLLWRAPWGDAWSILTSDSALTALRLSLWCSLWATVPPSCSACRWPGCWPGSRSPAAGWCGRCAPCRWCCRRSSPASPCSTRSAAAGSSASTSTGGSGSRCPSPRPASSSPRPSWPCRSSSSPWRRRSASSTSATRTPPAPSAPPAGTCSGASPCPPSARGSSPAPSWPGRGPWASSAPRSRSPATSRAGPRPCRWPSTSPTRSIPTRPSC